jgi:hypothetical protein
MNQSSGKRQSPEHRNYKESLRVKKYESWIIVKKRSNHRMSWSDCIQCKSGEMAGRLIPFRWWGG